MKIYTKTGDGGETALFGGGRVSKHHARVMAYGDVDELNTVLGVAMTADPIAFQRELLEQIQRDLFSIGGQLATPEPGRVEKALAKAHIDEASVTHLERAIDAADAVTPPLASFVLPGGSPKGAALHHARAVCRRAERQVVGLHAATPVPPIILTYLNRLSDLLFVLARLANHEAGTADPTW